MLYIRSSIERRVVILLSFDLFYWVFVYVCIMFV